MRKILFLLVFQSILISQVVQFADTSIFAINHTGFYRQSSANVFSKILITGESEIPSDLKITNNNILFAKVGNIIYKSDDLGINWQKIQNT